MVWSAELVWLQESCQLCTDLIPAIGCRADRVGRPTHIRNSQVKLQSSIGTSKKRTPCKNVLPKSDHLHVESSLRVGSRGFASMHRFNTCCYMSRLPYCLSHCTHCINVRNVSESENICISLNSERRINLQTIVQKLKESRFDQSTSERTTFVPAFKNHACYTRVNVWLIS